MFVYMLYFFAHVNSDRKKSWIHKGRINDIAVQYQLVYFRAKNEKDAGTLC